MKKGVSWDSMTKDRTVWIGFLRALVKICFVLIILAGALIGLSYLGRFGIVTGLLLGAVAVAVAVLVAFLVCSAAFIKLDMAEDVHALRQAVGSEDLRLIRQAMEYFLLRARIEGSPDPAGNKRGSTGQTAQNAAEVSAPNEKPFPEPADPSPEK